MRDEVMDALVKAIDIASKEPESRAKEHLVKTLESAKFQRENFRRLK